MSAELGTIFETLAKPNQEIKKEEKKKTKKSSEPWYDISKDNGKPEYKWDESSESWVPIGHVSTNNTKKEKKEEKKEDKEDKKEDKKEEKERERRPSFSKRLSAAFSFK